MIRPLLSIFFLAALFFYARSEGSKNITPDSSGVRTGANTFLAWLEHDTDLSGNFLDPNASAEERVYIYLKAGETLYYGIRRIPVLYPNYNAGTATNPEAANQDLTLLLYENDGTLVQNTTLFRNTGSTKSATLLPAAGVISSYARAMAGPGAVVGASGYNALVYTNNTGQDQDFYIAFNQVNGGSTNPNSDIDVRSWYDIWDFSVYDGNEEKPGRLHAKRWNLTTQYLGNIMATDARFYIQVPSVINGQNAGNYVKRVNLGGLNPFSLIIYANSVGSDLGLITDTNGDGVTDFMDARMSQDNDIAEIEYDLFINNPDIEIYPTTILPAVSISDVNFHCNQSGTGGEGTILINTNQTGYIAMLVDLNGTNGYQAGTADRIIELEATSPGNQVILWDGLDGLGNPVPDGTQITVSGRFTAGPMHIPMFDVESNNAGLEMLDVRPSTSFDLIYWDDAEISPGSSPEVELDGTNTSLHTWADGDEDLVNTWSFGYYQVNSQIITFSYECDKDGDGVDASNDLDNDNDGLADSDEGDFNDDDDADGIPNYVDQDIAGFVDANGDGINDNYDVDLDGIPDGRDSDSDNDGIPDLIEFGLTDANNDGIIDGFTDANGNGVHDPYDITCDGIPIPSTAYAVSQTNTSVTNPDNALGSPDAAFASTNNAGDILTLNLGQTLTTGTVITVNMSAANTNRDVTISRSTNGTNFFGAQTITINNTGTTSGADYTYTLTGNASYIRLQAGGTDTRRIFHLSFPSTSPAPCSGGVALTPPDTDGDGVPDYKDLDSDNDGIVDTYEAGGPVNTSTGRLATFTDTNGNGLNDDQEVVALTLTNTDGDGTLPNYRDIDSDNDGIVDNFEAQSSDGHVSIVAGDANGNGLWDIYDPSTGGTLLVPVDTDGDGKKDYYDTDADGDGISDLVEGWDANFNGFGDWDAAGSNNAITDETGYNVDTDSDGLWNIFDTSASTGIGNIIGSSAPRQNSDGADHSDWQDTDDDNDGTLTEGEDVNGNSNWTDDKTQGQGAGSTIPDYLFRGDYDGDAIADKNDADSDNDGILDSEEDNGEAIDPSGDTDNDGIPNYRDANSAGSLTNSADTNGDGVYDVFDTDLDGIPDFLDLDSDNDGVWDAIEAYEGSIPNGLNQTAGMFTLQDPDNDGLMNYVDASPNAIGGNSTLANPDSDSDGLKDYRDLDSDGDGITDIIEAQTTAGYLPLSNKDTDGDGIDDTFDPGSGGVLITPANTDALDLQDYLDDDSDNDNIPDNIEGNDSNRDGFEDTTSSGTDTDGDGLDDTYDADNGGTLPGLQNTDGVDQKDWRDSDDDNDNELTKDEDANGNGIYTDDHTDGQGISVIPDYLFNGDFDKDGVSDFLDLDDDNDGILDTNEGYVNVTLTNGSFESPAIAATSYQVMNETSVPGWSTTAIDGQIEIWSTGFLGTPSYEGSQFVEINANYDAQLYQDVATDPGTLIYWQIAHKGREGVDEFRILIGPTSGPVDNGTFATGNAAWVVYSGYYLVPAGQTTTRFGFESVSSSNGIASFGNLIDNFSLNVTQSGADADGDGLPNYLDRDSNNNGIADIIEAGGTDTDGDGEVDTFTDSDSDGLHDPYDANAGGSLLVSSDTDGDGVTDVLDLDSDNDGIADLKEAGGTDADGDGRVDNFTDTDKDGFADLFDVDNGGTALLLPDSDYDLVPDYKDRDSDNDGITDPAENGGSDTNNDGFVDGYATDTDGDGLADVVDPDNGGTSITNVDTDGDGLSDYRDLDSDNDGYPDIVEAGGTDTDNDGILDDMLDNDQDGIPGNVDSNDNNAAIRTLIAAADVTLTGGNDSDGDGIDNIYDFDKDGDGFSDDSEANPVPAIDTDGDGNKNFRDLDSDNDGITDVIEFLLTADPATGQVNGFADSNGNGFNDAQEGSLVTPTDTDSDGYADFIDLDADNDGIVDNYESQTRATYVTISGNDTDDDGLDDAYDPDNGGALVTPENTEGTGNPDYRDTESDGDGIADNIEGANANRNRWADWDTNNNNNATDENGYTTDVDADGILDLFDSYIGSGAQQIQGSSSAVQDTDVDNVWDFQDIDDDNDAVLTSAEATTPVTDPNGIIPDYLYGNQDTDSDGEAQTTDLDADNDGLANADEDGGTGIDPNGDLDGDGLLNYADKDMDGDGVNNTADSNTNGINTTSFKDLNNDGVIDKFDKDQDGVPDYLDKDSDNDGIADIFELGLTDANNDGTLDEGGGIADANGNGLADPYDPACDGTVYSGNATAVYAENSVGNSANAVGGSNNTQATMNNTGDYLVIDMGTTIPVGQFISIEAQVSNNFHVMGVEPSANGTTFGTEATFTFNATGTDEIKNYQVAGSPARYLRLSMNTDAGSGSVQIDALSYNYTICSGGVALSVTDSDGDGFPNYLDLDSDNDGITDNREAVVNAAYVAPVSGDSDYDGLLNVYDEDQGAGNGISPVDTDSDGTDDYLDNDSDADGVPDVVEGYDTDGDGYGDWDTDGDNDPSDESGYSSDLDGDGIRYLFDTSNGLGTIANINGSLQVLQDTDGDNTLDFADADDDGDGINTSAEDVNSNNDWTDDFTQGGGSVPDYLFKPDQDGDGVNDFSDADADNDGIASVDEFALGVIPVPAGGFTNGSIYDGDLDNDGIFNYLDSDMDGDGQPNNVDANDDGFGNNFTDVNNDGVIDQYDFDKDGIPDFLDLDSDNDGIYDGIEANNGVVAAGFNTATGRFTGADVDGDGVMSSVDNNDNANSVLTGTSTILPNQDFDGDGIKDFRDLDSDNDGITDNREAQASDSFITITNTDTDKDGIKDVYDSNNGGTFILPVNSDGTDQPDYRDTDSDNDTNDATPPIDIVGDIIEGFDANRNGFNDLDSDLDGDLSDETGYNTDSDGDGLWDLFDSYSGYGINNIKGSKANLQDTDADGTPDWRDIDDDEDNIATAGEDVNGNGDWTDDKIQGGGATPDYLFFNDTDDDGIADGQDVDGDNDGIPNSNEYNAGVAFDPFGDADGDGVFNYNDNNDPNLSALTDSNADGIYDEYDKDLDGVPNFFDLDSDNDGIPDAVEANGGSLPTDADSNGQFPEGTADTDQDGLVNSVDSSPNNINVHNTLLALPDTDGDGSWPDFLDLDSDSDGITDIVEAGGNDFNGNGKVDSFGDTDGDGLANLMDSDNSGTPLPLTNTDENDGPDYIDLDSEDDDIMDFTEGFYEAEPNAYVSSYVARVTVYNSTTSSGNTYPSTDTTPANGTPDYLDDADGDGLLNLLDPQSIYYYDDDADGVINLFDVNQNGNFYGNVSGQPDRDGDGTPNILDVNDVPLPLDFLSFEGAASTGQINLKWVTTNEVNVSHFEVEYSATGSNFRSIGVLDAVNQKETVNTYAFTHGNPLNGFNFYRVKEVDYDGKSGYTGILNITMEVQAITWSIYPNPTSDYFRIQSNVLIPDAELVVIDVQGREVYRGEETLGSNSVEVDIRELSAGAYYLFIRLPDRTESFRIIKK